MLYKEVTSYEVMEALRRAERRPRWERWMDRFNAAFWRIVFGV
jgi:hypothetical protein